MGESSQKHIRRRSWIPGYGATVSRDNSTLPAPQEDQELKLERTISNVTSHTAISDDELIPFTRSESTKTPRRRPSSASMPSTSFNPLPTSRPSSSSGFSSSRSKRFSAASLSLLTSPTSLSFSVPKSPVPQVDQPSSSPISNAHERINPSTPGTPPGGVASLKVQDNQNNRSGSFGKMAFNSVMGGLSALSLSRTSTNDEARGRTETKDKTKSRSSSVTSGKDTERSRSRARSQSPFSLRRFRSRDSSPTPLPLEDSDNESGRRTPSIRPRTAFGDGDDSGSEMEDFDDDEDGWSDDADGFDPVTERNTEQNSLIVPVDDGMLMGDMDAEVDPDPLGEGVNVVVPPEPYFPSTLNRTSAGSISRKKAGTPKRRKSRHHEELPHTTSRPIFQRDRCTINMTQGNPDSFDGKKRTYVVGSDMSEESRYAVEWGIGTVLRDGDQM